MKTKRVSEILRMQKNMYRCLKGLNQLIIQLKYEIEHGKSVVDPTIYQTVLNDRDQTIQFIKNNF